MQGKFKIKPNTTNKVIFITLLMAAEMLCIGTFAEELKINWQETLQRTIDHHPEIKKAIFQYKKGLLEHQKTKQAGMPTIDPLKITKYHWDLATLSPMNIDKESLSDLAKEAKKVTLQSGLSWKPNHSNTQLSMSGTYKTDDHKLQAYAQLSTNFSIKQNIENKIKRRNMIINFTLNEVQLRNSVFQTLTSASDLFFEIGKLQEQKKTIEKKLLKAIDEKKQIELEISQGKKTKKSTHLKTIAIYELRLDVIKKQNKLSESIRNFKEQLNISPDSEIEFMYETHPKQLDNMIPKPNIAQQMLQNETLLTKRLQLLDQKDNIEKNNYLSQVQTQLDSKVFLQKDGLKPEIGFSLSLPLNNEMGSLNKKIGKLQLEKQKIDLINTCKNLEKNITNSFEGINEQRAIIQLELQKLALEKQDINDSIEALKMGRISEYEFNKKQESYLQNEISTQQNIFDFLKKYYLNQINSHDFIHENDLKLPKNITHIFNRPKSIAHQQFNCDNIMENILKK